jgi:hypothetical protein
MTSPETASTMVEVLSPSSKPFTTFIPGTGLSEILTAGTLAGTSGFLLLPPLQAIHSHIAANISILQAFLMIEQIDECKYSNSSKIIFRYQNI